MKINENQQMLEQILLDKAKYLAEKNQEPELEIKKIECLIAIYNTIKPPVKLI